MADARPDPNGETGSTTSRPPRTPRWVKVFGIIALVAVLLFVVLMLAGGEHGPRLHEPTSSGPVHTGSVAVAGGVGHQAGVRGEISVVRAG